MIIRRLEEVSLHPIPHTGSDASPDAHGLPSYEQVIAINGPHDAPPPPYPGYHLTFSFDLFPYVILFRLIRPLLCHLVAYYTHLMFKGMLIAKTGSDAWLIVSLKSSAVITVHAK